MTFPRSSPPPHGAFRGCSKPSPPLLPFPSSLHSLVPGVAHWRSGLGRCWESSALRDALKCLEHQRPVWLIPSLTFSGAEGAGAVGLCRQGWAASTGLLPLIHWSWGQ